MNQNNPAGTLQGKKVIILGGSSGLGLATALAAAAEGAIITIVSASQNKIRNALKQLPESSMGYAIDLGEEKNIRQFFEAAEPFDHLVYTAGENLTLHAIAETDIETARRFFDVRYWGALAAVKYGASKINPNGSICLTGGIANLRPGAGWGLGASICGAMEGFMRAMAVELAPIRVNMVVPGVVKTNLWNSMTEEERENMYTAISNTLPVKRVGEAEDIAQTYLYLMKQQFGTGQGIVVDGGTVLV